MSEQYEIEKSYKVWDNKHGQRIEIGPDADGLNLVEIRYVDAQGKIGPRVDMSIEMAEKVYQALGMYLLGE